MTNKAAHTPPMAIRIEHRWRYVFDVAARKFYESPDSKRVRSELIRQAAETACIEILGQQEVNRLLDEYDAAANRKAKAKSRPKKSRTP